MVLCRKYFIHSFQGKAFWVQTSSKESAQQLRALDQELEKKKNISTEYVHSIPRKWLYLHSEFHYFPTVDDAGFQVSVIKNKLVSLADGSVLGACVKEFPNTLVTWYTHKNGVSASFWATT